MGLPSYVVNFDELSDLIKNYLENGVKVDIGNLTFSTEDIEKILQEIKDKIQGIDYNDLINALDALGAKLDGLSGNLGISGIQKIYGEMLEIPATTGQYIIEFTAPKNGRITGITYSLSTWNLQDNWDLEVEEEKLFHGVRTKEYGEHKNFNVFYPVESGGEIKFVFNNNSGSSKVLWVDFEILEGGSTRSTSITSNDRNYRFLAVGESEYTLQGVNNLKGCIYDADNMANLFKQHKESNKFVKSAVGKNKTKIQALNLIETTFQDASENDISYLFWSGHGTVYEDKFALVAKDNIITIDELEEILDNVKGTKIILIDTCYSGLAIDKDFAYTLSVAEDKLRSTDKTLNKEGYKILTAASKSETSKDLSAGYDGNINPSGAFTWALTEAIRTKSADKDGNKIVTLNELYENVLHFYDVFNVSNPSLAITQKAQVYPNNDSMPIFEYIGDSLV